MLRRSSFTPIGSVMLCFLLTSVCSAQNFRKLADLHSAYVGVRVDARFVYFPDAGFMKRVPKEGGVVEQLGKLEFCASGGAEMEADGYSYSAGGNLVERCSASGGAPEVLAQVPGFIRSFALTPTKIAWVTEGSDRPGGGLVQVMPRSGGPITDRKSVV